MDIGGIALGSGTVQYASSAAQTRDSAQSAQSGSAAKTTTLSADEGRNAVSSALESSRRTFDALRALQADIQKAVEGGLDDQTKASLNKRIADLAAKIDGDSGTNILLSAQSGSVTVSNVDGLNLTLNSQSQNAAGLGLRDADGNVLQITDDASLRKVSATLALAAGKAQTTNFRLEAAQGLVGAPDGAAQNASATGTASQALGAQLRHLAGADQQNAAPDPNAEALAAVRAAVSAQRGFNQSGYGVYGVSAEQKSLFSLLS